MKKNFFGFRFTKGEIALLTVSAAAIIITYILFDRQNPLTLAASLVGVVSLIFCAKGNPLGQLLVIVFSILYSIISYQTAYYGEMITYAGMTAPMALFALISWLKHPYQGNRSEVEVNKLKKSEFIFAGILALAVTAAFYFILKSLGTANIIPSTISVTTSFAAVYLTFRRSEFYALGYATNDIILIVLWTAAAIQTDVRYISVATCFTAFLVNDIYGFICWSKMKKRQARADLP